MPELCRLCGGSKELDQLYHLKDPELEIEIKLEKTFNYHLLDEERMLSQFTCFECFQSLEAAHMFFQTLTEVQIMLRDNLVELDYDQIADDMIIKEEPEISTIEIETEEVVKLEVIPVKVKRKRKRRNVAALQVNNRWNGGNPIIKMEDIFEIELNGIYENAPETLNISDDEKNPDGTLTEAGLSRVASLGWNSYAWKCIECLHVFGDTTSLEQHFKDEPHQNKLTYACADCPMTFRSYFSIQNHIIEVHKPFLKFCCEVCSEFRWNLLDLHKHRQELHPKNRNCCLYCGRLFECGFYLRQHVAVHKKFKEDELYSCDVCGAQVHTKFLMRHHMASHNKGTELICEQCGKVCRRLSDMRSHQLTHTMDRPFECDICNNRFKCKKQLRCHKKTHFAKVLTAECSVCFKKFATKGKLTRHFRIHTNDYAYTCEFCGKKFIHASGFETHRRIHTGERPYVCTVVECSQKFIDWPNWNKHMKTRHGIDNSTRKKKIYLDQAPPDLL